MRNTLARSLIVGQIALSVLLLAAAGVHHVTLIFGAFLFALPVLWLAAADVPLLIVQRNAQFGCAAVLCACAVVLLARRDRFEWGWIR